MAICRVCMGIFSFLLWQGFITFFMHAKRKLELLLLITDTNQFDK